MAEGHEVAFVGLHGYSADNLEHQAAIYERMTYPLLQERADASPRDDWESKDRHDIFVFSPTGALLEQIHDTKSAHTATGYDALKTRLVSLLK